MDYDRVQKDAAEAPVAEETVAETVAEEDECPFDMD
jgi:hypothetical protein